LSRCIPYGNFTRFGQSTSGEPEWFAFSLKLEYLELIRYLEQSGKQIPQSPEEALSFRLGDFDVPTNLAESLYAGHRFLKHEPDRSRRALRLLFANWLAHVEIPELRQKRPAVRVMLTVGMSPISIPLYPVSPQAPAGAWVMSPHEVASWLISTKDAKRLIYNNI
jgi:hypothetical protein